MTTWREFLVEHAKFPFPRLVEDRSVDITDISNLEVGLLAREWKAQYAVRDETLVQKLCQTLENILGDTVLPDDFEDLLLSMFGRRLQFFHCGTREVEDRDWSSNGSERQSRALLDKGCLPAANVCLDLCGGHRFQTIREHVEQGRCKVDYLELVDDKPVVLVEAQPPLVMKMADDLLPARGFELKWIRNQPLVPKILQKAALSLGLRKMEWLFLTCHNYWIICHLARDDENPFLAYSPNYSIENSSEPFRAFLGAILSIIKAVPVQTSVFNPDMELDIIPEEVDNGPEDDIVDGSGADISSNVPSTRSRATTSREATESGLMITSSSPDSPESFQVWVHLHSLPNNRFAPPQCAEKGNGKQRLWLTRLMGYGSTGNVWQCRFDNGDGLFAIKVVELLRKSDVERQRRLCNEFEVYLTLEMAYQSGQLRDRITPHCYGAFGGDGTDVLILELCDGTINSWDELNISERTQVYRLVRDLHRVGIFHGDLEPRNIARFPGGGFRLIDFTESGRHTCEEFSGDSDEPLSTRVPRRRCCELRTMRNVLKPLQTRPNVRS
ncbi:hypothetical protein BJY52DRAFT_1145192 [Lactarius psammicola]|nr:hypothetical protein BJY52DRAFT_1145192 [Lactarius psammicola]